MLSTYSIKYGTVQESADGFYTLRYNDLIAPMIKAIQELKAQLAEQRNICQIQQDMIEKIVKMFNKTNESTTSIKSIPNK